MYQPWVSTQDKCVRLDSSDSAKSKEVFLAFLASMTSFYAMKNCFTQLSTQLIQYWLCYTNWKIWRDMTDFRDANDYLFFFFAVSVIVFWHANVCGWLFRIWSICWPTLHSTVKEAGAPSQSCKGGSARADDCSASSTARTNGWGGTWGSRTSETLTYSPGQTVWVRPVLLSTQVCK